MLTADKVTVNSITLSDSGTGATAGKAGNYSLAMGRQADARVVVKAVSLSGVSAASRTEDGTSNAVLSGGSFSGLVGLETLALSGQFDNKNVGDNKSVTVNLVNGLNGGKASNYSLNAPVNPLTASIWSVPDIAVPHDTGASGSDNSGASNSNSNSNSNNGVSKAITGRQSEGIESDRYLWMRSARSGSSAVTAAINLRPESVINGTTTQVIDGGVQLP